MTTDRVGLKLVVLLFNAINFNLQPFGVEYLGWKVRNHNDIRKSHDRTYMVYGLRDVVFSPIGDGQEAGLLQCQRIGDKRSGVCI